MKRVAALIFVLMLSGCYTMPHVPEPVEPKTVVKMEYVLRIPPKDLLAIPAEVPDLDVDTAKQSDVAKWISANEARTNRLEEMIRGIAKFLRGEQDKLEKKAKDE